MWDSALQPLAMQKEDHHFFPEQEPLGVAALVHVQRPHGHVLLPNWTPRNLCTFNFVSAQYKGDTDVIPA
jgi:hypothetical protein